MYLLNTNPPLHDPRYLGLFAISLAFIVCGIYFTVNRNHPKFLSKSLSKSPSESRWFTGILVIAFLVRLVAALSHKGFDSDVTSFSSWGMTMLRSGPFDFYKVTGSDGYPPLYNLVLGFFTIITGIFRIEYNTSAYFAIIKMPAILCDMAMGIFIYKLASRKLAERIAVILSSLYLFNPAIILNSSSWGQTDAVFTLAVVLCIYYIIERKLHIAMPVFLIGLLMKPQTVIFTPILLLGVVWEIMNIIKEKKTKLKYGTDIEKLAMKKTDENIRRIIISFVSCVITFFAFSIVFSFRIKGFAGSLTWLLKTYLFIISSYPYADLSAFNFFGLIGGQWIKNSEPILDGVAWLTWKAFGNAAILILVATTIYMYVKSKAKSTSLFLLAAYVVFGVCTFGSDVHERYVFPAIALILVSYIYYNYQSLLYVYIGLSALHFINIASVLFVNNTPETYFRTRDVVFAAGSFLMICLFVWYSILACKISRKKEGASE